MSTDDLAMHRDQAAALGVEALAHVAGMLEAAVQVVGPLVVGAHQHAHGGFARFLQARATVAAHIAVRADLFIIVAQDQHRRFADVHGVDVTGLIDIGGNGNLYPMLIEEDFHIRFENILAAVQLAVHAKTRLA
ncbi:hypothetical protein D3C81_1021140 [compost metagenome]